MGKAHSPREDVLKIRYGSESCQSRSYFLKVRVTDQVVRPGVLG
jgi:hypothetical protein